MPYDSNGNYTLPGSYFVENGDTVLPVQHNPPLEDIQAALSSVILRSGVAPMGGNLKMGAKKIVDLAAGTATTDAVNKAQMDAATAAVAAMLPTLVSKAGNYTALDTDYNASIRFSAAATLSIDPIANLRTNWRIEVLAAGGPITIDPNASELINGASTLVLSPGLTATIIREGTAFFAEINGTPSGTIATGGMGSAPTGWLKCNGAAISRTTYAALFSALVSGDGYTQQTFTVSIASPGVFSRTAHGFTGGERLRLSTTGALPTGLNTTTDYFVIYVDANTYQLSASDLAPVAINTSGTQSGTHSHLRSNWGLGDGTSTFNVPDYRGIFPRGVDDGRGVDAGRAFASAQPDAFQGHWFGRPGLTRLGEFFLNVVGGGTQIGGVRADSTNPSVPITNGVNGTPRIASETRPMNAATHYFIKI
ncbi:phage tail protein [Neorhizobium galegae]|uniref:phage tail protein n=1 Tax=Neorhizobium galegae TaxID=399 RepID=UPI0006221808|nr:phage tail protein [Neorhizobium galegae]CDZ50422.1 Hypothetical protein NGAL_HAMBI2427_36400 [Neorhizobium galegae bv. orientalis]